MLSDWDCFVPGNSIISVSAELRFSAFAAVFSIIGNEKDSGERKPFF